MLTLSSNHLLLCTAQHAQHISEQMVLSIGLGMSIQESASIMTTLQCFARVQLFNGPPLVPLFATLTRAFPDVVSLLFI